MTEEIKEIEQYLKKCSNCFTCNNFLGEDENGGHCMLQNAYNYITNLQKENEELKEELQKADSITQSCIFEGSRSAGKSYRQCLNWLEDYKSRNEKAVEYIKNIDYFDGEISDDIENIPFKYVMDTDIDELLNILEGGDE